MNSKRFISFSCLTLLLSLFLYACGAGGGAGTNVSVNDVGSVEGAVTDSSSAAALSGVTVQIGDKTATTGANGVYSITDLAVGSRTITSTKTGYQSINGTVTVTKGTTVSHNIQMMANGITPDTTPPTVSSSNPANGATGVAVSSGISVTFSEAMDCSTITTSSFTLKDSSNNAVAGSITTCNGAAATFTPSANLTSNNSYTATITTAVKDAAGNAMTSIYTWSFTTETTSDTSQPSVLSTNPTDGVTGVGTNVVISATFNKAMDASTLNTSTFIVTTSASLSVTGAITYTGNTVTFTPTANLAPNTTYIATITTAAKDSAGNPLATKYTWSFTLGSSADTTAPSVTTTSPSDGTTGIPINVPISATFSEKINPSTITAASFVVSTGGSNVSGVVTYDTTYRTATFSSSSNLSPNTTYTAKIVSTVKDVTGNSMASDYIWSFTTGTLTAYNVTQLFSSTGQGTELSAISYDPSSDNLFFIKSTNVSNNEVHRYNFGTSLIATVYSYPSQWDYGLRVFGDDLYVVRTYDNSILRLTNLSASTLTQVGIYPSSGYSSALTEINDITSLNGNIYFVAGNMLTSTQHNGIQYLQGPDYNTSYELLSSANAGWPDPQYVNSRSIISSGSSASAKFVVATGSTGNIELRDISGSLIKSETGYGDSYLQKDSQDRIYAITGSGFNTKITRWSANLDGKEEFFVIFSQYNGGNGIRFILRETGSNVEVIMTQYRASSPVFYKTTIPK